MKVYYDKDADLSLVKGRKVTIIGYGSQGHAHAQNLTDSGVKVTVGLRRGGASWDKVKKAKIAVKEVGDAVKGADVVMILLPDESHAAVYRGSDRGNSRRGDRDQLPRGDGDRPFRRADGPLRWHRRAHQGGLRDAGGGGLCARDGLLRVPARDQAHRRPDL